MLKMSQLLLHIQRPKLLVFFVFQHKRNYVVFATLNTVCHVSLLTNCQSVQLFSDIAGSDCNLYTHLCVILPCFIRLMLLRHPLAWLTYVTICYVLDIDTGHSKHSYKCPGLVIGFILIFMIRDHKFTSLLETSRI